MRRWMIWAGAGLVAVTLLIGGVLWSVTRDLPDEAELARFSAALPSTVRDIDGNILTNFTRERRIYLTYDEIPPLLVKAYISAEDKTFFEHGGLDYLGIINAVFTNLTEIGRAHV